MEPYKNIAKELLYSERRQDRQKAAITFNWLKAALVAEVPLVAWSYMPWATLMGDTTWAIRVDELRLIFNFSCPQRSWQKENRSEYMKGELSEPRVRTQQKCGSFSALD